MKPFRHMNAGSVAEALTVLSESGGKARLMAGGTDLLGLLKSEAPVVYPQVLINIKTIPDLACIWAEGDGLAIGATTKLSDIAGSPLVKEGWSILAEAAESVGMPQIRRMGTLGGNLAQETRCWYYRYPHRIGGRIMCRRKGEGACLAVTGDNRYHALFGGKQCFAVCPSDMAVALAALDAGVTISGPDGRRTVPVVDFYRPLGNALSSDEMITDVRIPRPAPSTRQVFRKYRVRDSIDFAIVSVGLAASFQDGICATSRIVLGGVAPGPYRAIRAEALMVNRDVNPATAEAVAEASLFGAVPLSRNGYKLEIIRAMVKAALLN